jgi:hypothetical protein
MNKEQLRKLLEDVAIHSEKVFIYNKFGALGLDNKLTCPPPITISTYITSVLSAMGEGKDEFVWTDELVEELIWDEYGDNAVRYKVEKFKQSKPLSGEGEVEEVGRLIEYLDGLPISSGEGFEMLKAIKQKLHETTLPSPAMPEGMKDAVEFVEWLITMRVDRIGGGHWEVDGLEKIAEDGKTGIAPVMSTERLYKLFKSGYYPPEPDAQKK